MLNILLKFWPRQWEVAPFIKKKQNRQQKTKRDKIRTLVSKTFENFWLVFFFIHTHLNATAGCWNEALDSGGVKATGEFLLLGLCEEGRKKKTPTKFSSGEPKNFFPKDKF